MSGGVPKGVDKQKLLALRRLVSVHLQHGAKFRE